MSQVLTFLHTSPVHVATFNNLIGAIDPNIKVKHIVNEGLLREAQAIGEVTPALAQKVKDIILDELENNADVVLCTCSTIGPVAEQVNQIVPDRVVRVDRPMAAQAVNSGTRILVLAALTTTFIPTRQLILDEANKANKHVELTEILCEGAWSKFEQGDKAGYLQIIATFIDDVADKGDVIVLAQASMAEAALLCKQRAVPVLSSPQLGLEAAIHRLYQI